MCHGSAAMIKKLVRHGNSRALVIDKPILDLLKIADETEVEITTDGQRLIITPVPLGKMRQAEFEMALEEANREWGNTLKRLSE
jgi:antitoxin MazE